MNTHNNEANPTLQNARVVAACEADVAGIYSLLSDQASQGNLLPRSIVDISRNFDSFFVARVNEQVVGCAALEVFTDDLGEVRSLAVHDSQAGQGLGAMLVGAVEQMAHEKSLNRMMALTYVPDFFHKLDYRLVPRDSLPEKIWGVCMKCYKFYDCDEIAVLKYLNPPQK